ncbi:cyclic nucleotide-binding domain-containing protein [bacterium]|nr:cyclic nucleotide-binding domain-containing protein [bacterium]
MNIFCILTPMDLLLTMADMSPQTEELYRKVKEKTALVIDQVSRVITPTALNLNAGDSLPVGYCYLKKGFIKLFNKNKLIRFYSDGDLLCVPQGFKVSNEFLSQILVFDFATWTQTMNTHAPLACAWGELETFTNQLHLELCSLFVKDDIVSTLKLKSFKAGDCIIREGEASHEIFHLIQGEAEVSSHNKKLATISANEIFGEMGYLTGEARHADVKATSDCLVNIIKKDDFLNLVNTKPRLAEELLQTLARRVAQGNSKILGKA